MPERYPEIEPYASGLLAVGDGDQIYWETCGNPTGKPALVVHGGPGSACSPGLRRYFDPSAYRVVLFDQRGCGRSTPHAGDPTTALAANDTEHLLADMERLREHLGIDRWLLFGGSWGSVLSLVYAERHPHQVSEIVLTGIATGRRAETDLLTRRLRGLFPESWAHFRDGITGGERDMDLSAAYARLVNDPDAAIREPAVRRWWDWENAMIPGYKPGPEDDDLAYQTAYVRIVTHYWSHGSWLEEGQVIGDAGRLAAIPGVLVQGTLDLGNLIGTPWELVSAWPGSELVMVDEGGHGAGPGMAEAIVAATDRFASHRTST